MAEGEKLQCSFFERDVLYVAPGLIGKILVIKSGPRIGINYAGDIWKNMPWRYYCPPTP